MSKFFGIGTKRAMQRQRGERGARMRVAAGMQERIAPRPRAAPGTVADRAEKGFQRRVKEMKAADTPEKRALAREKARKALERYHKSTVGADQGAKAAQARLDNSGGKLSPQQIDDLGFSMVGGRLVEQQIRVRNPETKKFETQTVRTRIGRNRKTMTGVDMRTHQRLTREAAEAKTRHGVMKRRYAKMYRELTGKGGRSHQMKPPEK